MIPDSADASRSRPESVLRFVHVSDTHIHHSASYNLPNAPYPPNACAQALVEAVNGLPFQPDFVLHTGDVAYDPDPRAYAMARKIFSQINCPIRYLSGNHDNPLLLQQVMLESEVPLNPFDFEFQIRNVQVVCVDSHGTGSEPSGSVTESQLERLAAICRDGSDDRLLVVAVHHNVLATGIPWWDRIMGMAGGEAFHRNLLPARHRLRGVFHGHVHQMADTLRDGILYSGVASTCFQLHAWPGQTDVIWDASGHPGFNVVTVTSVETFIRRHSFSIEKQ